MASDDPREVLLEELREHALMLGDFVLASGRTSTYLIDAKRAIMRRRGFEAMGGSSPPRPSDSARLQSAA